MSIHDLTCRSCKNCDLSIFLDLGKKPPSDRILTQDMLDEPEPYYPLEVAFCNNCSLVQILETVPPGELFSEGYQYYSSFIPALLKHSKENAAELIESSKLDKDSFVIELASNDGYLLRNYVERGIPVLGIDPAPGQVKAAEKAGVRTLNSFFTLQLAEQLRREGKTADVVHANNVLAHVEDTIDFIQGIKTILKDNGVAVIEVPYVKDLVEKCEFDTIYHEHLCYFSVTALDNLFRSNGLFLNHVRKIPIHGGSLRLYVEKIEAVDNSVYEFLEDETVCGLDSINYYQDFANRVETLKSDLKDLLLSLKKQKKKIAAYGAAAKGSTMINFVDIGNDIVDFVVDRNTFKHHKYMPGKHLPIFPVEKIIQDVPDYTLILAWNFAEEIMQQQEEYRSKGGKFIIPVPSPTIV